jgi:UDP-4-amino-4,6-dideoxy-N-acetyl-beta-L-altrosamine transaminase
MIPYGRQDINSQDVEAVIDVLHSEYLTQGHLLPKFEMAVAEYCGADHAIGMNSATSALHVACLALNIGPGDVVWTAPNSFVASANCAIYCGASIDFVDIDINTLNISIEALKEKLDEARSINKLPKAIIPVHFAGQSCDMQEIQALSEEFGFSVIEDASHAIGGDYLGEKIGGCKYSDITIFSFHAVKIITTGEGGMALTNSDLLAEKMRLLRSHGITRNSKLFSYENVGPWHYEQIELGYNYRLTEIQSALGLSQIKRLNEFVKTRNELALRYNSLIKNDSILKPYVDSKALSSFHLYVVQLKGICCIENVNLHLAMRSKGINVNLHYIPIYLHPYYRKLGFGVGYCKNAELYYERAMTLPLYPSLTKIQQDFIVDALTDLIAK